jgi:hypothetical protein
MAKDHPVDSLSTSRREAARAAKAAAKAYVSPWSRPFVVLQHTPGKAAEVVASYWSEAEARAYPGGTHIAQTHGWEQTDSSREEADVGKTMGKGAAVGFLVGGPIGAAAGALIGGKVAENRAKLPEGRPRGEWVELDELIVIEK